MKIYKMKSNKYRYYVAGFFVLVFMTVLYIYFPFIRAVILLHPNRNEISQLTFQGRLVDQYDHPLPGRKIEISGYQSRDGVGTNFLGIKISYPPRLEKVILTDDKGDFNFNSGSYQGNFYSVQFVDHSDNSGFRYENVAFNLYYTSLDGWPKSISHLLMRATRKGVDVGNTRLISIVSSFRETSESDFSQSVNLLTGETTDGSCTDCDLILRYDDYPLICRKFKDTTGLTTTWKTHYLAPQGGIQLIPSERFPKETEKYGNGYYNEIIIEREYCDASGPEFYFFTRNRQIWGRLRIEGDVNVNNRGGLGLYEIKANPRGVMENLAHPNDVGILPFPIRLPFRETLDVDKVQVITSPSVVKIIGLPGSITDCRYIQTHDNYYTPSFHQFYNVESDGSFNVEIPADKIGTAQLMLYCDKAGNTCDREKSYTCNILNLYSVSGIIGEQANRKDAMKSGKN